MKNNRKIEEPEINDETIEKKTDKVERHKEVKTRGREKVTPLTSLSPVAMRYHPSSPHDSGVWGGTACGGERTGASGHMWILVKDSGKG